MKREGSGGANTLTGLNFESKVDFQKLLGTIPGCEVNTLPGKAGLCVFFDGKLVARCFRMKDWIESQSGAVFCGCKPLMLNGLFASPAGWTFRLMPENV